MNNNSRNKKLENKIINQKYNRRNIIKENNNNENKIDNKNKYIVNKSQDIKNEKKSSIIINITYPNRRTHTISNCQIQNQEKSKQNIKGKENISRISSYVLSNNKKENKGDNKENRLEPNNRKVLVITDFKRDKTEKNNNKNNKINDKEKEKDKKIEKNFENKYRLKEYKSSYDIYKRTKKEKI